ncbi:copper resistance CopC family protein [Sphaerimonospora sp. CA-214678]|uniref:copper resistance CopC family protein n=1 Tax=Sphaerimonospora sp. CA-214678 TaxID=3240029 RepID=UPI003D8E651F
MRKHSLASVAALIVTLVLGVVFALPVRAHASLKSSDPAKNAQVQTLSKVTLEFTESVRFPVVVVQGPGGKRYESGDPVVDGPKVVQAVVPSVPAGEYTIAWRIVSSDGHPVEGEIPFTVTGSPDAPGTEAAPGAQASSGAGDSQGTEGGQTTGDSRDASGDVAATDTAAAQGDQASIPGWAWAAVFGIAGVGIGLYLSLRKKS